MFFNIFKIFKITIHILYWRVSRTLRLPTRYNMCPLYKLNSQIPLSEGGHVPYWLNYKDNALTISTLDYLRTILCTHITCILELD